MHAFVLLQTVPAAVDSISAALAEQPGFLGLEELPGPDAAGYAVDPQFQVLEYASDAARAYAAWIARDGYRATDQLWLRVYLEIADATALTNWLAAWQQSRAPECSRERQRAERGGTDPDLEPVPALVTQYRITRYGFLSPQDYVAASRVRSAGRCIGQQFWVGPPWDLPPANRLPVIIDPGMAFGTGDHPTTQLCLELLEQVGADLSTRPARVLDVGTGSGILAIAATKLLPDCELWTTDLDPQCAANAARNFELNGLPGLPHHAFWGAAAELTHVPAPRAAFDVVLTNIYSSALGALVDPVATLLRPGGTWIVSGLLAGEQEQAFRGIWNGRFECASRRVLTQDYSELSPTEGLAPAVWEWAALDLRRTALPRAGRHP